MECKQWEILSTLQILNEDGRRSRLQKWQAAGLFAVKGFTLYKQHLVPAIIEEQRALGPSVVSVHYAEIRAGLRWSLLSDEQQNYWCRCERTIFDGSLWPLKVQTLENFLRGAFDLDVEEDELEDDDDNDSFCNGYRSEEEEAGWEEEDAATGGTAPQESISPPTSPNERSGKELSDPATDAALQCSESMSPLESEPRSSHDHPEADLVDHTTDPAPQCLELASSHESKPSSAEDLPENDLPGHELPDRATDSASRCLQTATPSESDLLSAAGVADLVARLRTMTKEEQKQERNLGYIKLDKAISENGFTLFRHHAIGLRLTLGKKRKRIEESKLVEIWDSMPASEQSLWRDDTVSLKHGLSDMGSIEVLNHFNQDDKSQRSRRYRLQAKDRILLYRQGRKVDSTMDNEDLQDKPSLTTIVDVLYEGNSSEASDDALVGKILRSIQTRLNRRRGAIVRVRRAGMRIHYNPSANDVTAIGSRLRAALKTMEGRAHAGSLDRQRRFESLLKPFAYFNTFMDLASEKGFRPEYDRMYNCCLEWVNGPLETLRPLSPDKKHDIVRGLMQELRKKVYGEEFEEVKSRPARKDPWDIHSDDHGFALQLLSCFHREDLQDEVYSDKLEQQMYHLFRQRPDIGAACGIIWPQPKAGQNGGGRR